MIKSNVFSSMVAAGLTASLVLAGPAAARDVGARLGISAATSTTTIPLQVRLASSGGTPTNGLKTMTFKLYTVSSGGSALWSETWTAGNAVRVTDGVASVLLGSQTALPQSIVANNSTLYLGITVDVEAEMQPRVQLGSSPIAMTVPDGTITINKLASDVQNSFGADLFRNALINGNMDIWQRTTNLVNPSSKLTAYAADRWHLSRTAYETGLAASRQDGTGVAGSRYALRVQRTAGNTSTSRMLLIQVVETPNTVLMRGRKWTLSFWARKGANFTAATGQLEFGMTERTAVDESAETYGGIEQWSAASLTTGWQKFTLSMNTAVQSSTNTFKVVFAYDPSGTAGENDYFEITQVQLNAGDTATPFAAVPFEVELQRCKRYYQKSYDYDVVPGTATGNGVSLGTPTDTWHSALFSRFDGELRTAVPQIAFYSPSGAAGTGSDFCCGDTGTITTYDRSSRAIGWVGITSGGLVVGRIYQFHWTADAEP